MVSRVVVGMIAFALGACLEADVVTCADGRVCPAGARCDDERQRCVSPEQLLACSGRSDDDACTFSGAPGTCRAGACDPLVCGDGLRSGTESCDGSDLGEDSCESLGFYAETTGLACGLDCRFDTAGCTGACGDGIVNGNEQCDGDDLGSATCQTAGFYDPPGLACSPFCTWDVSACTGRCGDGEINGGELCDGAPPDDTCVDLGFDAGPLSCSGACSAGFGTCARFGWRTFPAPLEALAIAASSATNLWAVGQDGVVARSTGGAWTVVPTGLPNALVAVSTTGPDDVWAIGLGVTAQDPDLVVRRDQSGFHVEPGVPAARYVDVYAAAPNAVFVATADAGVLRFDGSSWAPFGGLDTVPLDSIRGTGATDVWAVATDGTLHRSTGGAFAPIPFTGLADELVAIAPDDVWVLGAPDLARGDGLLAHWNGTSFTSYLFPSYFISIAASAHDDAWAVDRSGDAYHFDGSAWIHIGSIVPPADLSPPELVSVAAGDVRGVSFSRVAYESFGQATGRLDPGTAAPGNKVAITSDPSGTIYVADNLGNVGRFSRNAWASLPDPGFVVRALWSAGPDSAVAVGTAAGQVFHWNGTSWVDLVSPTSIGLNSVTGPSLSDLFVFGAGGGFHYDGSWTPLPIVPGPILGAASKGTAVYAVRGGTPNELYRWTGSSFELVTTQTRAIHEIAVVGPTDVYAVSDHAILHWNGTTWSVEDVTPVDPRQIIATAPDDITVASPSALLHFDGTRWSPIRMPIVDATNPITNLAATPARIDILFQRALRGIVRIQPWVCVASETQCSDHVDEDCDGFVDRYDSDCP